jgi:hypothetical protein
MDGMTTLENVEYGWGQTSVDRSEPFWVKFSRCKSEPAPWDQEIRKAAIGLANASTKPIWICLSGGIDSEAVCELFSELKIPFNVLTLAFEGDANGHDIKYAREWCSRKRVNQKIVPFNIERFAETIPERLNNGYLADHLFRYYQIHLLELVEEMGGFAILGGGEQLYELNGDPPAFNNVALNFDVGFCMTLEWCKRNHTRHEPYFYLSRPEIVLSWLRIPLVEFCLNNPDVLVHPQNKYVLKVMAMRMFFRQQVWRPKYNGFENVEHVRHRVRAQLRKSLGNRNQSYHLKVHSLLDQIRY